MNFRLARDRDVHLETVELGGITKYLMTGSAVNVRGSRGNKTYCFPWGQSLSAY